MWSYKDAESPKLTQEFRDNYIVNIKGKDAVTANGLIVIGHEKGIKSLKTKIIQYPNKENDDTCIVEASVVGYGYDPVEDKTTEVEYTAIGDANPANCSKMVAASFIRMAETRAIGRVMRNYTNIGMLCSDEVSTAVEEHIAPIKSSQVNLIASLMKQNGITKDDARTLMIDTCNKTDLRALSESEAEKLIVAMKSYTAA